MANILLGNSIIQFFFGAWFIWVPIALLLLFVDVWIRYVRVRFIANTEWVLLEFKIPRDIAKSPQAMESFLASIHGSRRLGNMKERYWDGWLTAQFSLEIVGDEKGVHFYIWAPKFFKRMIESQTYAQYPDIEIQEVSDYTKELPPTQPHPDWKIWGTELLLSKPDAYPIRTYEDFPIEDISTKEEDRKIDPLAALIEFLGNLKGGEKFWLQILVRPSGDEWKKEGEELANKLAGREIKKPLPLISRFIGGLDMMFRAVLSMPDIEKKKEENQFRMLMLTPGEQDTLKALQKNTTKLGFDVGIRWIYLAKPDVYNLLAVPAIMGIFKQYASQSLNSFKANGKVTTSIDYVLPETRVAWRRARLFNAYKLRSYFYHPYNQYKPFVLSSSELATIFHFPGSVAGTAALERIQSKKGAPPSNLPI
jgi:hypothetical protein